MDLRAFVEMVRRRKRLVLLALLITASPAFFGALLLKPFYDATARFVVRPVPVQNTVLVNIGLRDADRTPSPTDSDMPTRVAQAMAEPLLRDVIWKLQIRDGSGKLSEPSRFVQLARFSGRPSIRVAQAGSTQVISIKARSRDPEQAAMIANTLTELYFEQNLRERRAEFKATREALNAQLAEAKVEYLRSLGEIRDFMLAEGSADPAREMQNAVDHMAELMKDLESAAIVMAENRAREAVLRSQLKTEESQTTASGAAAAENPQIEHLMKQLADMETMLAGVLAEKRPEHPEVEALNRRIANLRDQLKAETTQRLQYPPRLQEAARDLAAIEARWTNVNQAVQAHVARLSLIPSRSYADAQLKLRFNVSRDLYETLLINACRMGMAEAMMMPEMNLLDPAPVPPRDRPAGPKRFSLCALGIFLGLVTGVSMALVADQLSDKKITPDASLETAGRGKHEGDA